MYITASCAIVNNTVFRNSEVVFKNDITAVPDFLVAAYHHFDLKYPKFYKMDNLSKLGVLATEVLLNDRLLQQQYEPQQIGIVLANASSSLDTDIKYFATTKEMASPALFVYTLPNIVMGEICIKHHFKGENAFFISEKFDAVFLQQYVSNLINNNILQACICGWVEVLGDQYKTVLLLVETKETAIPFDSKNINKIYDTENG